MQRTTQWKSLAVIALLGCCLSAWAGAAGLSRDFQGPDGKTLPFHNDEEILEFLKSGEIVSMKKVGIGVTGVDKVRLSKDGVDLNAVFRDVRIYKPQHFEDDGSITVHFRDDYIFELAAYRLGRLLGLDNIPPVVKRRIGNREGTLQLWIEDAVMEGTRIKKNLRPPLNMTWRLRWNTLYIFDYLIGNGDRNLGNILYDPQWKMWMIDHTRAFRLLFDPEDMERIKLCPRPLYQALKRLDRETLDEHLGDLLGGNELKAVEKRRLELIQYLDDLIDRKGAEMILH
ncbi:MAG TPA: hypothetical protein VLV83_04895 [Acidobacteriota bacterium]|nr:hypothetical protein [Acidobacteriota bacterium]